MTNPHDPYGVGYRRATRILDKVMLFRKKELNIKQYELTDCWLELANMKKEFRVIVYHHDTVKSNL